MANIYTIYNSENQRIGQTPIRRQAENSALGYAKRLGRVMFVDRTRLEDGDTRRVQFNPDGTLVLLWKGGEVRQGVMA